MKCTPIKKCAMPGCYAHGAFLCDFPLPAPRATCDRAMCAAHRFPQEKPGVDYCAVHDEFASRVGGGRPGIAAGVVPETALAPLPHAPPPVVDLTPRPPKPGVM